MNQVTAIDVFGDDPAAWLANAAAAGDKQAVAALAASGSNVNARGDRGVNLVQWAFLHQSIAGMTALLAAGADATLPDDHGNTVMHYAAAAENPAMLQALLDAGVPVDARNPIKGETPLFTAIMHDREPQFQALLAAGADVDAVDAAGNRPLHQAAKVNDPRRVLALLEAGADPRALNGQGVTFQRYLNAMDDALRTAPVREAKAAVDGWLRKHGIGLEPGA
jgi:ankyrin repeat protein